MVLVVDARRLDLERAQPGRYGGDGLWNSLRRRRTGGVHRRLRLQDRQCIVSSVDGQWGRGHGTCYALWIRGRCYIRSTTAFDLVGDHVGVRHGPIGWIADSAWSNVESLSGLYR